MEYHPEIFEPYDRLIEITICGEKKLVPENNSILRCLQYLDMERISNANPQQEEYNWGKAELMDYINADGKKLRGILIKPEDFDPSKKYPLMVYIYEQLTDGLHSYRRPNPGCRKTRSSQACS